jgi:hypothetical protein
MSSNEELEMCSSSLKWKGSSEIWSRDLSQVLHITFIQVNNKKLQCK